MKYVHMNEAAFDHDNVAFPGIANCHGIVYQNDEGLFAYHQVGALKKNRVQAFAEFVANHPDGSAPGRALLGFTSANRFTKNSQQKAELKVFAKALNYPGKVRGYRWDLIELGWRTAFVDVHFQSSIMSTIENYEDINELGNNDSPYDHMTCASGSLSAINRVVVFAHRNHEPTIVIATPL